MCLENGGKITKKIYCSLLSGVLLFFVLSLCSNSYGANYNITSDNIDQLLSTYSNWLGGISATTMKNRCNNYLNTYNSQYDNSAIEIYSLSNGQNVMYIYFFNNANITSAIYSSARSWRIEGTGIFRCGPTENTTTNIGSYVSANTSRGQYFMISNSVKSITNAPIQSRNVMTFLPVTYFTFNYISNLQDIIVEDFNTMKIVNSNFNILNYVAEFGQYINLDTTRIKPEYIVYKYEKPQNYFEPLIAYDYNSYQEINDDLGIIFLSQQMLIPNTIIDISLSPIDIEEFDTLSILFYITDENTVITNGELDENNTFDDDYYNRYTNIINNILNENKGDITTPSGDISGSIDYTPIINGIDNINNTLNDDTDTDSIISSNLSGDYASFGEDLGYQFWENPFFTFLINILEDFYDALTERGNIQISLNSHNINNWILNTDDFVTPNTALKNVCRLCLIFFYIYFNYKFFYHLITLVQTFRIKTTISVLGTDEFYDTDYM